MVQRCIYISKNKDNIIHKFCTFTQLSTRLDVNASKTNGLIKENDDYSLDICDSMLSFAYQFVYKFIQNAIFYVPGKNHEVLKTTSSDVMAVCA